VEQNLEIFEGKMTVNEAKTSRNDKEYYRLKIEGATGDLWFTAWPPVSELILSQPKADWRVQYSSQVLSGGQTARTIRKADTITGSTPPPAQVQQPQQSNVQPHKGGISRGVAVNGLMSLASKGGWFKDLDDLMVKAPAFNDAVDLYETIASGTYTVQEEDEDFLEVTI